MRYRILTTEGIDLARAALQKRSKVPPLMQFEAVLGTGEFLSDQLLRDISLQIGRSLGNLSKQKPKRSVEELDRDCFAIVHSMLPRDELMLGDLRFWQRFAIVFLSETIHLRFPGRASSTSPERKVNLDNFGLGSRKECWPYKLWVRGELSHDPTLADPYELGRVGSVDMWTSHAHRQNFMSIAAVRRGLLKFQYPQTAKGRSFLYEGEENPGKGGVPGLRTLVKRLRENWASVEYVLLDSDEAESLIRRHAEGLTKADGKTVFA